MEEIIDVLIDTSLDALKILPFLFLTYLLMEYIEHKAGKKTEKIIEKSGDLGPILGAILGVMPQCGFSISATNLFAGRVITMGTLIAVYLSTSDEMLPILISNGTNPILILKILSIKVLIGIIAGFIIDIIRTKLKKQESKKRIEDICEHDHCHCENGIFKSAIKHTAEIFLFIVIISLCLNFVISLIGEENLANLMLNKPILGPLLAGLIGLIPNCASSVILTELYTAPQPVISLATMIAGLLVNSGLGIIVLFRVNKNIKENLKIVGYMYLIGVISGVVLEYLL